MRVVEVDDVQVRKTETGEVEVGFSTADPEAYERGHRVGTAGEGATTKSSAKQQTEKSTRTAPGDSKAIVVITSERVPTAPTREYAPLQLHHAYALAPIPHKLNYKDTPNSALFFLPNHPPLLRSPTSPDQTSTPTSSDLPPSRPTLSSITLTRTYPFASHRTWVPKYTSSAQSTQSTRWRISKYLITTLIALIPVLLTGILSRFQPGNTTSLDASTWRVFTLQWLGFGTLTGLWWVVDQEGKDAVPAAWGQVGPFSRVAGYVVSASPAVGGYIVVGQMLYAYGVCVWVGD